MIARIFDNHWMYLDQVTPEIEQSLDKWFSARDPKSYYSSSDAWDGIYRKFNRAKHRLSLAYMSDLKEYSESKNIPLDIEDQRPAPEYPSPDPETITEDYLPSIKLEKYQVRALRSCCENEIGIIQSTTGSGKTELACGMVKLFSCPTVIITEQIVVLEQIIKRLKLRDVVKNDEIGMFCFGKMPTNELIMVGSIQSLSSPPTPEKKSIKITANKIIKTIKKWIKDEDERLKKVFPSELADALNDGMKVSDIPKKFIEKMQSYLIECEYSRLLKWYKSRKTKSKAIQQLVSKCDLLIVDEADLAVSTQYSKLFKKYFSGRRKYGLTGTPFDPKKPVQNLILRENVGNVIFKAEREEVEAAGRIVPISYYTIIVGADGDKNDSRAYDIATDEEIISNVKFHNLVAKVISAYSEERNLILLGTSPIEPLGKSLEEIIPDSKFIFGKTPQKVRNKYIKQFEEDELSCLIGSLIFKRGLDLHGGVDNLIIIGGGGKYSEFVQRIGRALRLNKKGKSRVISFLFLNNKYLYKHSRANLKTVVELGYRSYVLHGDKVIDGEKFVKSRFRLPK